MTGVAGFSVSPLAGFLVSLDNAGPFHADVGDALLQQPGAQGCEILVHGAEAARLPG
jgi:hypothetical protein